MGQLLQFAVATSDDVAGAHRLTREVAQETGVTSLEQKKLATVVAELARRALATAGACEVTFSVETAVGGGVRLFVAVSHAGPRAGALPAKVSAGRAAPGLGLGILRRLVDHLELVTEPGGGICITAAVQLSVDAANDPGLDQRLNAIRTRVPPTTPELRLLESVGDSSLLEAQSVQLKLAASELERVKTERAAANAELATTNRGVLDLIAELSVANESLAISGEGYRQLADQQSALADLGHRAVASGDVGLLAMGMVGILRRVLGIKAVGILRFKPGKPSLEVVATDGCEPDQPTTIDLGPEQARSLRRAGTLVADPIADRGYFPLLVPQGSRSSAVVPVHTPAGPWGVLVACDTEEDGFTGTTTAFLEAAVSVFAFSITRMVSEEAALHAASHDGLTGLPNRDQLLDHLARALEDDLLPSEAALVKPQTAVIFIDIDGFKQVNDTAGHAAGDRVLIEATGRLQSRTRPTDILSRLGGDEFVVVCDGGAEAAAVIAERLLSAFDDPFVIDGRDMFLSASAGIALAEAGVTSEQILADADIAMYQAKKTPGSTTVAFHPQMRAIAESESRLQNELRRALERGELRAVYQPIVDLADGTVRAVETLLRWRHPDLGDVPAQHTVAAAERIGLAWDFTAWIAVEAAGTISAWNAANLAHPPLRLAVNFTPLLLGDPSRVAEFEAHVTGAGLPFGLLDVELTETAFADPTPDILATMTELHRLGARLVMDDFGTGYSSLMALAILPLDVLKIDREFVSPLDHGGDSLLVSAMTAIARGRHLETVGEGIETEGQLIALIAADCDLGQGYLLSRPLERERVEGLATMETRFVDIIRQARLATPPYRPTTSFDASRTN